MSDSYSLNEPNAWRRIPGGDFRSVLMNGIIAGHHVGPDGEFVYHYMRAVPFVPPLSFLPSAIIATEEFKASAEQDVLSGLRFRPVYTTRLVHLEWRHWTNQNWIYPSDLIPDCDGEPEDYLLRASPDLHVPSSETRFWTIECLNWDHRSGDAPHFFAHDRWEWVATQHGREWLERKWTDAVDFKPIEVT